MVLAEKDHITYSDEWSSIALVVTTSSNVLLTAGMAHRSKSGDDVLTDEEDSGEIHYIPLHEFEGYEVISETHAAADGSPQADHSESPAIRLNRKRPADYIQQFDEPINVDSEIEADDTPRPTRPLPFRSPHGRTGRIPPPQPVFAPPKDAVLRRSEDDVNNANGKRRRVVLTEDEAREAQQRLESVAHQSRNATRAGQQGQAMLHESEHTSGGMWGYVPSAPQRPVRPSPSPLPPHSSTGSQAQQRLDIPSSLAPELFAEARRQQKAKRALLEQHRAPVNRPGLLGSHSRHAVPLPRVVPPPQLHSHPATTPSDVFYSPTQAFVPPSRRAPHGQSSGHVRQESVAGPSSSAYRKNGSIKGRYPPLM